MLSRRSRYIGHALLQVSKALLYGASAKFQKGCTYENNSHDSIFPTNIINSNQFSIVFSIIYSYSIHRLLYLRFNFLLSITIVCKEQIYRHSNMVTFHHGFIPLIFLAITLQHVLGGKVPAIIVFGDSSVDTGNNNAIATVLKSNFRPYGRDFDGGRPTGRFSNGRVPADFISEFFGLKKTVPGYLDPMYDISDFSTGVCFASAGTGYDNSTAAVLSVIPLWKEVEYYKEYQARLREYLGEREADHILSEALYLISIGTNDFLENYYLPTGERSSQFTIEQYQDFLVGNARNFIVKIYNLGARKMSLGGLPPMGCLPLERTTNIIGGNACISEYNNVAKQFNSKLEVLVNQLNGDLPGVKVLFLNPYGILLRMIRTPSLYGFKETSRGCCATGRFEMSYLCNEFNPFTCTDATKFVFWDSFHPTEKANFIIAKHVFERSLGPKFL